MKWTYSRKKKILDKINRITNKEDMVTIFNIIKKENKPYKELQNSILLFFHDLHDETYDELNKFINTLVLSIRTKNKVIEDYVPYTEEEFKEYSKKERSILWGTERENELDKNKEDNIIYVNFR